MAHGYSYARIKKRMWDIYGLYLIDMKENVYKAYRYPPYTHLYKLLDENNVIVLENVTLKALADMLKAEGEY